MAVKVYNSLTRRIEPFRPIDPDEVTMYTCGPTVYDYVTVGNYRTYTLGDLIYRILTFDGYKVKYMMNLTDVGHLTGDNMGDADTGEDRLEMSAEREGRSAKEVADFYIADFYKGYDKLNLTRPAKFLRATSYIREQIDLVRKLEEKGFTYTTSDGVYFDTSLFKDYGQLSGAVVDEVLEGARVEVNPEKKNPADFALWKFSPQDKVRWQEWDSPWGKGYPGWHLECSAMCMAELGETIDIHIGGEDLRMIHHPNEIAQSEAATGKKFVNYWVHGAFLQVDGGRMGKSLGNAYTLTDLEAKNYNLMSLRYFYLTAHYRRPLNFTWESLQNAQNALKKLYDIISGYQESEGAVVSDEHIDAFKEAISDDFNMPNGLAVLWDVIKSDLDESTKIATILKMDEVFGLDFADFVGFEIPEKIKNMAKVRWEYKKQGIWDKADLMRKQIEQEGFVVQDTPTGFKIRRKV